MARCNVYKRQPEDAILGCWKLGYRILVCFSRIASFPHFKTGLVECYCVARERLVKVDTRTPSSTVANPLLYSTLISGCHQNAISKVIYVVTKPCPPTTQAARTIDAFNSFEQKLTPINGKRHQREKERVSIRPSCQQSVDERKG